MVFTRSKTARNTPSNMNGSDRYSDAESESSIPEVLTREQMNDFDNGNLLDYGNETERRSVNQRFTEMNKQISELTNLVLALTEKISSNETTSSRNREGNVLNTTSTENGTRSDMVTGVGSPIMVNTRSKTARNTPSNMNGSDRYSDAESESSIPEVLTREQMNDFDNGNLLNYGIETERRSVNQRFTEMNKQISELTNLVLALTEKISSNETTSSRNREGNVLNTTSTENGTRSDMVTGVGSPIMVNTRSKTARNTPSNMNGSDRYSDAESESSIPEVLTREQMNDFDNGNLLNYGIETERRSVNQRFTEMNKQISELTNLVLALTEKISSNETTSSRNREGNVLNTTSTENGTRSDMVTGVGSPLMVNTRSKTARNTPSNMNGSDRYSDAESESSILRSSYERTNERL